MSEGFEEGRPEIIVEFAQLAGVWANRVETVLDADTLTIDFTRMDPFVPPPGRGIVVARVAVSPAAAEALHTQLEIGLRSYARSMLPPEIYDDGEVEDEDR